MDMSKIAVFRMTTGKMSWLAERQRVLAQNVANADTPGYRSHDLAPVDFRKIVERESSMRLRMTDPAHVSLGHETTKFRSERVDKPYEVSPSGNAVVLEEQLIKAAQTAHDYELMTNLYRKHMGMFKIAVGRGQGQ